MNRTILLLLIALLGLTACSSVVTAKITTGFDAPLPNQVEPHRDDHAHDRHSHVHANSATAEMQVVLVPSELVVGPNRFAVGLFDAAGHMIEAADVHFHYYDLSDPNAPLLDLEADAVPLQTPDGLTTIFAQERRFDRPGQWGVEVQARFPDGTAAIKRIGFQVLADSPTLTPGERAPALETLTDADVKGELTQLASASEPNPAFYQLSLAEALASGKPTLLLFSTPAFCQTRMCGPAYELAGELQERYGQAINFIHVEVFTGLPNPAANNWEMDPAMAAFGLTTEPWLYLIDAEGTVIYRVEGLFTTAEVEPHLQALLP